MLDGKNIFDFENWYIQEIKAEQVVTCGSREKLFIPLKTYSKVMENPLWKVRFLNNYLLFLPGNWGGKKANCWKSLLLLIRWNYFVRETKQKLATKQREKTGNEQIFVDIFRGKDEGEKFVRDSMRASEQRYKKISSPFARRYSQTKI